MSNERHIIQQNQLTQEEYLLYDAGTERAFLACIQMQPELIIEAERMIPTEWIFIPMNRYVYSVMLWIYKESSKYGFPLQFDAMSMLAVAQYMGPKFHEMFMTKTDGLGHVRAIEAIHPSVRVTQYQSYASILVDRANRVMMYRECRRLQEGCLDLNTNPVSTELAVQASDQFGSIAFRSQNKSVDSRITRIGDADEEYFEKIGLNLQYPGLFNTPVNTFPFLMDLMNGGWRRRGLAILCARPKVGKSTILLCNAIDAAMRNIPVLYIDTEMSREEMYSRTISHVGDVKENAIMAGHWQKDESFGQQLMIARQNARNLPLFYVNVAGKPIHHITSVMRQFRNKFVGTQALKATNGQTYNFSNPCLVIYDWLKLPDPGSLGKNTAEYQMLGFQCSTIKDAANELDLPVIAGAQNNRNAINFDSDDWMEIAEAAVGGSDRIAQFCTFMGVLRNVLTEEEEAIRRLFPLRGAADAQGIWTPHDGMAGLAFNQYLHVYLQRGGGDYRRGIPLYLDRGKARYEEMAKFVPEPNLTAQPTAFPNAEKISLVEILRKMKLKPEKSAAMRGFGETNRTMASLANVTATPEGVREEMVR